MGLSLAAQYAKRKRALLARCPGADDPSSYRPGPLDAVFDTEMEQLGCLCLLMNSVSQARSWFEAALRADESALSRLSGRFPSFPAFRLEEIRGEGQAVQNTSVLVRTLLRLTPLATPVSEMDRARPMLLLRALWLGSACELDIGPPPATFEDGSKVPREELPMLWDSDADRLYFGFVFPALACGLDPIEGRCRELMNSLESSYLAATDRIAAAGGKDGPWMNRYRPIADAFLRHEPAQFVEALGHHLSQLPPDPDEPIRDDADPRWLALYLGALARFGPFPPHYVPRIPPAVDWAAYLAGE